TRAQSRSSRPFRNHAAEGQAAVARLMGARSVGSGALLDRTDAADDGARAALRYPGLFTHLRVARHGAAGAALGSRIQRAADRTPGKGRRARPEAEPRPQRLAGKARDRTAR